METEQELHNIPEEQEVQVTPGDLLRAERERQGLTEKQVADKLHITMHYVRAVESNRFDKLPGQIFARGYIKSYAELLGLDITELLSIFDQFVSDRQAQKEEKQRIRSRRRRARNLPWVYASVATFIGAFLGLWILYGGSDEEPVPGAQPQPRLQQAAPAQQQLAPPSVPAPVQVNDEELPNAGLNAAAPGSQLPEADDQLAAVAEESRVIEVGDSGSDILRISFSGESWIEVNDGGSGNVYRDIREAGDILEIHGTAPFNILLGDAPFTRLSFNGNEIDVSDNIRIDNSARLTVGL